MKWSLLSFEEPLFSHSMQILHNLKEERKKERENEERKRERRKKELKKERKKEWEKEEKGVVLNFSCVCQIINVRNMCIMSCPNKRDNKQRK